MDRTLNSHQRGLTLVELLIVMTILALMAGVVAVNAPPARTDARNEADRFAARVRAAAEDAVVKGAPIAIEFDAQGYQVNRYANGEWVADGDDGKYSERRLPAGMIVTLDAADASHANADPSASDGQDGPRRVVLDSLGAGSEFSVSFGDLRGIWLVKAKEDGSFEVVRHETR